MTNQIPISYINSLRSSDAYMHQQTMPSCTDSDNGLPPVRSAPSHYLNHCWIIVNCPAGNKPHWNVNQNTTIFVQQTAYENVVCNMAVNMVASRTLKTSAWLGFRKMAEWEYRSLGKTLQQLSGNRVLITNNLQPRSIVLRVDNRPSNRC